MAGQIDLMFNVPSDVQPQWPFRKHQSLCRTWAKSRLASMPEVSEAWMKQGFAWALFFRLGRIMGTERPRPVT